MKQDNFIWIILTVITIVVMGILGWWNYIQTEYNKFLLVLVSVSFVLILIIWGRGVKFEGVGKNFEPEE